MASQSTQKSPVSHWKANKRVLNTILFIILAVLIEVLIVVCAISLGTSDPAPIKLSWPTTIAISPLFHIMPVTVIITLVASWAYLTNRLAKKSLEQRIAPKPQKQSKPPVKTEQKLGGTMWRRIRQVQDSFKTAITITIFFLLFILIATNLAYPQLIYRTIASGYQNNSGLTNFVSSANDAIKGLNQATGPLGGIATAINNEIRLLSPGIRAAGVALGNLLIPLATIDPAGKYIAVNNIAAWITVLVVIFYVRYIHKPFRYRRR